MFAKVNKLFRFQNNGIMHTTQTLYLVKEKISQIDQMEFLRKQQQKQQTE